jgi:hypothetical protein
MRFSLITCIALGLVTASLSLQAANPRTNYLLYCSGCHLVNGEGNHPNVPTLHNELGRMMTVPAMREYLVRIPGASQAPIDDAELTEVINWVLEQWNSETLPEGFARLTLDEVSAARKNILADPLRYRSEHWKEYSD